MREVSEIGEPDFPQTNDYAGIHSLHFIVTEIITWMDRAIICTIITPVYRNLPVYR